MAKRCMACRHEKRAEIDAALVGNNETLQSIAHRFGVSKSGLFRHQGHIKKALAKAAERKQATGEATLLEKTEALEAVEALDGNALIRQMTDLQARTVKLLDDAEKDEDGRLRAVAIHQIRLNLETMGRFLIELRPAKGLTPAELMALSDQELDDLLRKAGLPVDELQDRAVLERPAVPIPAPEVEKAAALAAAATKTPRVILI